jgi:hypothetical protein
VGPLVAIALVALLTPMLLQLAGRSKRADALLQKSFEVQTALVNGVPVPASRLAVLHRWKNNAMQSRYGELIQVDANWLCRTEDGHYAVAIAQSMRKGDEWVSFSWRTTPPQITWTWRTLSEAQVRNMLVAWPKVYRQLFGADA